jgi:hypothetical protein
MGEGSGMGMDGVCQFHERTQSDIDGIVLSVKEIDGRVRDLELSSVKRDMQYANLEKTLLEISKSQLENKNMIMQFEKEVRDTNEKLVTALMQKQDSLLEYIQSRVSDESKFSLAETKLSLEEKRLELEDNKDARANFGEIKKDNNALIKNVIMAVLAIVSLFMGFKEPIMKFFGG